MKLSEEQISQLIDKFIVSEEARTWSKQREEAHQRWKEWIEPDKLKALSNEELKNRFLEYFREGAGRHPFNAIYRDRVIRDDDPDTKTFREVMIFLLDESVPVRERVNGILDQKGGIYHIDGMGKGLVTSFLMDLPAIFEILAVAETDTVLLFFKFAEVFKYFNELSFISILKSRERLKLISPFATI